VSDNLLPLIPLKVSCLILKKFSLFLHVHQVQNT